VFSNRGYWKTQIPVEGTPTIQEPMKCSAIGWFTMNDQPLPLSQVTSADVRMYILKHGSGSNWYM
jgi:hypothetical protein